MKRVNNHQEPRPGAEKEAGARLVLPSTSRLWPTVPQDLSERSGWGGKSSLLAGLVTLVPRPRDCFLTFHRHHFHVRQPRRVSVHSGPFAQDTEPFARKFAFHLSTGCLGTSGPLLPPSAAWDWTLNKPGSGSNRLRRLPTHSDLNSLSKDLELPKTNIQNRVKRRGR